MQGFGGITRRYRSAANDSPQDGIAIFQRTVQALALITVVAIGAVLVFGCGASDVEVTAAQVAAADEMKARISAPDRAAVIQLSHPLPYSASITQSGDGIAEPRTRFYIPTSAR
jgi:hypothetical protein